MLIGQKLWTKERGWVDTLPRSFSSPPQLVLVFGSRRLMAEEKVFKQIKSLYPGSHIICSSTAGEIMADKVYDDSISITAVLFEKTKLQFIEVSVATSDDSEAVGKKLVNGLKKNGLVHAMVFSDGLLINGTALVKGLNEGLSPNVSITGGLVGDGYLFKETAVGLDHVAQKGKVVLIGFSGSQLKVGYGSFGGWQAFGLERLITKSNGNVLYELDGKPVLELYKKYLGDKAKGLPSTGLLFPLRLNVNHGNENEVVRTILSVDEANQSMTFAGDMPEGAFVSLMRANLESLIDGASEAGKLSVKSLGRGGVDLAVLISCVGRKLVLKERTEEEIEAVRSTIGQKAVMAGFYSYGELCPLSTSRQCRLHNQTMTVTTFRED